MPGGDGTGPGGMGPMTGRAAGYCAGYSVPGYANPVGGRGMGMGWGRGRGFGRGFGWARTGYGIPVFGGAVGPYPPTAPFTQNLTAEQELKSLKVQAEYLEGSLKGIKERIDELQDRKQ